MIIEAKPNKLQLVPAIALNTKSNGQSPNFGKILAQPIMPKQLAAVD
jgi:hypothetical protein